MLCGPAALLSHCLRREPRPGRQRHLRVARPHAEETRPRTRRRRPVVSTTSSTLTAATETARAPSLQLAPIAPNLTTVSFTPRSPSPSAVDLVGVGEQQVDRASAVEEGRVGAQRARPRPDRRSPASRHRGRDPSRAGRRLATRAAAASSRRRAGCCPRRTGRRARRWPRARSWRRGRAASFARPRARRARCTFRWPRRHRSRPAGRRRPARSARASPRRRHPRARSAATSTPARASQAAVFAPAAAGSQRDP